MGVLVLHTYTPGCRPADQTPTWEGLVALRKSMDCNVRDWPCEDDYSYARALEYAVSHAYRFVNIEQDIVPEPKQVFELAECPENFCAMDYFLPNGFLWSETADHAALGLAKITNSAWERTSAWPRVPNVHWRDLAGEIGNRIGYAHIHDGPVIHNHLGDE